MGKVLVIVCLLGLGAVAMYSAVPAPPALPSIPTPILPFGKGRLVLYTQSGCQPCVALKRTLAEMQAAGQLGGWTVEEVNDPLRVRLANVSAFPTLVAQRGLRSEVGRKVGAASARELQQWLTGLAPSALVERIEAKVGGVLAPDGTTEILCDLPNDLHRENTASKGLGNCVFTSIHHTGLWQNVPAVVEFPKWLIAKGIPGGGWPEKVKDLIPKIAKDRNLPTPTFFQVEGPDLEPLRAACRSGRMPAVTYSYSATGRYRGQEPIAHMVTLAHLDDKWAAILDNNYPGSDKYEWLTIPEFEKTYAPGWAVIFLAPGPPPPPRNLQ